AAAYAFASLVTYANVSAFLKGRGVQSSRIWNWDEQTATKRINKDWLGMFGIGAFSGTVLGLIAVGYRHLIFTVPAISRLVERSGAVVPSEHQMWCLAVVAIGFAPLAEEYLFRGLLFRAIDREWGGWRAFVGGAALFAIYHPPISWLPVGALG